MTEGVQGRQRKRRRLWLAVAAALVLLIVFVVPPLISIGGLKGRITRLMSASLGRPVHLSSVELRLLPRPGFVLNDLTVEEDPAYGAEPVLHANTVIASVRLLALFRGRLEIGVVSVDEASLNLVRTAPGRWNLDPIFRTAAARVQPGAGGARPGGLVKLPYLEATNSRINIKNGPEKLPFALVNTDFSFWQENPGDWRIRLRGQPARTDLSLGLADTGVVRLEASMRQAPALRKMPLHVDLEWRDAQLGQLTRLVLGSDAGWRGDLTGELHLDGTAEAAQITTRLRAEGVHRSEFAPAAMLDFDARCGFVYHFTSRSFENLACDSPLGDGHIRLAGALPGEGAQPHFSVELDRIPVQAALDALRTVRSDFGPGLEARGAVSGKISYAPAAPENAAPAKPAAMEHHGKPRPSTLHLAAHGPLTGSFTVEGFQLSGDSLKTPIKAPKLAIEPVAVLPGQPQALAATVAIPAGGALPLTVTARMALSGYQVTVRGQAALARARELAHVAGMADAPALDELAGEPVAVDLSAQGPWLPVQKLSFGIAPSIGSAAAAAGPGTLTDSLSGTVTLHNANWKADYLANHVEISQATLHLENGTMRWDPVVFVYGPVKGSASLTLPPACAQPEPCLVSVHPAFSVQFGDLDAGALQAAILGAQHPGTLLSSLIARFDPSSTPVWPQLEGTVKADSLILGPVTLRQATATLRIQQSGAEITGLDATLLGGRVHGAGTLSIPGSAQAKPAYTLTGHFEKLSPADVGQLIGLRFTGSAFDADGKIGLSGFTGKDLAASVKGTLHFDWRHGSVAAPGKPSAGGRVPVELARFDRWTADAEITNGAIALQQNQVRRGSRKQAVEATVTLGHPPKVEFAAPKVAKAKR
jgi:hypothetical protein